MPQPIPVREKLYSVKEVAEMTGYSVGTLYQKSSRGEIGKFKTGGLRFPESEVLRLKRKAWVPARLRDLAAEAKARE